LSLDLIEFRAAAALLIAAVAMLWDVRTRRIPNALTLGAAALGLGYGLFAGGAWGLLGAGAGWLVAAVLFFPFFALGGMGAGDVKLLAALGAWFGPAGAVWLAIYTAIAGGAMGAAVALYHGYLRQALVNVWLMLMHWRVAGPQPVAGLTLRDSTAPRLAYAIPIAVGVMCTLWQR
jgi:prepilin peptidase CpaA